MPVTSCRIRSVHRLPVTGTDRTDRTSPATTASVACRRRTASGAIGARGVSAPWARWWNAWTSWSVKTPNCGSWSSPMRRTTRQIHRCRLSERARAARGGRGHRRAYTPSCCASILILNTEIGISISEEISLDWNLNLMNCLKKKTCLLSINMNKTFVRKRAGENKIVSSL